MQGMFGSVRRSLGFDPTMPSFDDGGGGWSRSALVEKIGTTIRKSRIFAKTRKQALYPPARRKSEEASPIRWAKGGKVGSGAFGTVYMGMNLESGELLAVKQVSTTPGSASNEKMQARIRELEEEVKLLKDLSHQNIVKYFGTTTDDDSLNILMEFVSGGSISSLLEKFGPFSESVIKRYTRQLLLGLEYLHKNKILHRDIKGANILVDQHGCIKLADFGASKKVLATINGAKSMKGTPNWMAPEVIQETGHSFSADIWSVGCTIIEMATGKPPWSVNYHEVPALFYHIVTSESPPTIPENLSAEAKDFLLKCLQKDPNLRPNASTLLEHPFVASENQEPCSNVGDNSALSTWDLSSGKTMNSMVLGSFCSDLKANYDDEMCQIGDVDELITKFSPEEKRQLDHSPEDDEEPTESKIKAFLDEKTSELKKLQTPLFEEYYNTSNGPLTPSPKRLPSRPSSDSNCGSKRLANGRVLDEIHPSQPNDSSDWQNNIAPSAVFSEQKKLIWEEELHQELERRRELLRQAGVGRKTSSPKYLSRFASPGK